MYKDMTIYYSLRGGDLLPATSDDRGTYNEIESIRNYADMLRSALEVAFPGAAIALDLLETTSGGSGKDVFVITPPDSAHDTDRITEHIHEISGLLWESWTWVLYE